MNDIGKTTYEHIRGLLYGKEQKEMTISAITMNYVFDYVDNLQSKIDKANEYLESHFIFDDENGEYYQTHTFDKDNAKELHEILKEDK